MLYYFFKKKNHIKYKDLYFIKEFTYLSYLYMILYIQEFHLLIG